MLKKMLEKDIYRNHREKLLLLLDLFIVAISYVLAYWIKNDFRIAFQSQMNATTILCAFCVVFIIYTACFIVFKIYKSLWKYIGVDELLRLALSNALATIVLMFIASIFINTVSIVSLVLIAGIFALIMMSGVRTVYRLLRRFESHKHLSVRKKVIIIGAGDAGNLLLRELNQNPELNYDVVGFIDDTKKNIRIGGYDVLGTTDQIEELKEKHKVEGALIAISHINQIDLRRIYDLCIQAGLETKIMNFEFKNNTKNNNLVADIKIEDLLGRGEIHLDQAEISSYISDKVVAVTGAGGSIGSELCRQIVRFQPRKLILIDINENYLYMLEQEFKRNIEHGTMSQNIEVKTLIASIREKKAIDEIFERYNPDVVYHAAAHKHVPLMEKRPMEAIKNNVFGTNNVIHSCIEHKVKRFIMISTDKAVNPTNVMGATKRMTEMLLQANGNNGVTQMAAVRFGNVLGSNGSVIPIFKAQIAEGGPITITSKEIIRYFMTIPA